MRHATTSSIPSALAGALTLSLLLGPPGRGQERLPMPAAPKPPAPSGDRWQPHRLHVGVPAVGPEVESDLPDELVADPTPGRAGDEWGTQPVSPILKGNPYRLAFVAGDYTPAPTERLDPELSRAAQAMPAGGTTYGVVMFQGRITTRKRQAVEATGVRLYDHHTFNCMTAAIPLAALPHLQAMAEVRWVGYAKPWQKIDPALVARQLEPLAAGQKQPLFIKVHASDLTANARRVMVSGPRGPLANLRADWLPVERTLPEGPFQRALEAAGVEVVDYFDDLRLFAVKADLSRLLAIASLDFVHYVEPDPTIVPLHDRSTRQIHVDYVRSAGVNDGRDTVVGIMDSGIDLTHVDHAVKWYCGWTWNTQNPFTDPNGHGTHVAGTIGSSGVGDNRYIGCAPASGSGPTRRIYLATPWGGENGTAANAISALTRFGQAYTDTSDRTSPIPSVTNHSWGTTVGSRPANGYVGTDALSIAFDNATFARRQLQVVSSGNGGGDDYATQNYRNQIQPAVSKLALVVASAVSHKESATEYPGRPHFSSSKGPTGDDRLSPQVMAPGRLIKSCTSGSTDGYHSGSGTSMAAPHVTGTIAGLHSHYTFMKDEPALTRAVVAATTNPYEGTRTWTQADDSYYNRQGMGMIDAYKTHYQLDEPGGFLAGRVYGTFGSAATGWSFDMSVPADATRTQFVLAFDEKAPSNGAVRACIHDLDLYIDVAPFTAGFNTGEFSSTRAWDTWDWIGNVATIGEIRGKQIRVKVYPRVKPSGSDTVRFAVAYMIPRGDTTPAGTVSLTGTPVIKPNQTVQLSALVNVPAYMQTNSHVELFSLPAFTPDQMQFYDRGGLLRTYLPGPQDWTMGLLGSWFAANHRRLDWTLKNNGQQGLINVCVALKADNRTGQASDCVSICVDGQAPQNVAGLGSTSHQLNQWSSDQTVDLQWSPVADVGCAGIDGFAMKISPSPSAPTVKNYSGNATGYTALVIPSNGPNYFNLRAIDKAGNLSASNAAWGPFYIDNSDPTVTSVTIAGGALVTASKQVAVQIAATDTYSGVDQMRFSGNDSTWSAWQPFAANVASYDLTAYGGGSGDGLKTVSVQVRDQAGNVSATKTDGIILDTQAPVVDSVRIDNDATATSSLSVSVTLQASSGPTQMRLSSDNATWTAWQAYSGGPFDWQLDGFGGNDATGQKPVWCQVRDTAGNVSASKSDTILYYLVPVLTTVAPSTFDVVHDQALVVDGSGLADVTKVMIGTYVLTSKPSFRNGWFEVRSGKQLVVHPPQLVAPARLDLSCANPAFTSKMVSVTSQHNATPFLATSPSAGGGSTIDILLHRGSLPANAFALLTMSASSTPLVLPGLISLEHGGNAATLIDPTFTLLPTLAFDGLRTAQWKLPLPLVVPNVRLYFEAVLFDPADLAKKPMLTSNADATVVQ